MQRLKFRLQLEMLIFYSAAVSHCILGKSGRLHLCLCFHTNRKLIFSNSHTVRHFKRHTHTHMPTPHIFKGSHSRFTHTQLGAQSRVHTHTQTHTHTHTQSTHVQTTQHTDRPLPTLPFSFPLPTQAIAPSQVAV